MKKAATHAFPDEGLSVAVWSGAVLRVQGIEKDTGSIGEYFGNDFFDL